MSALALLVAAALSALGGGAHPESHFLAFTQTPRFPGNLVSRVGIAGRSREGRPITVRQIGDPALPGRVLVFGCIHGDECGASAIEPLANGCPDPHVNTYLVPELDPDGAAIASRLNSRGVDLNRNFPAGWRRIGGPGDPEYSGPRPFSEPETRLAARIIQAIRPHVTIWFHQHAGPRSFVRAWGQSAPAGRRFAHLARISFHLIRWQSGTAPNWQNHGFPGTASYVVELPRGRLPQWLRMRLGRAIDRIGRREARVGED